MLSLTPDEKKLATKTQKLQTSRQKASSVDLRFYYEVAAKAETNPTSLTHSNLILKTSLSYLEFYFV